MPFLFNSGMGKDLNVHYYPNKSLADKVSYGNSYSEDPIIMAEYEDAVSKSREFSENMSRNWDLSYYDYFNGTKKDLLECIKEFWDSYSTEEDILEGDEYEYENQFPLEALANLTRIASECPHGWYIVIRNG